MAIPRKNRGGRPPHQPTEESRRAVQAASGYGLTHEELAHIVGIDPDTLRKHYRTEMEVGVANRNISVTRALFRQATSGSVAAAIYWTKARMGWREMPQRIEITSLRDMAAELAAEYNLTPEEAIAEAEALIQSGAQQNGNGNGNGH